jgi:uncharacterized protein YqfB (UPF0267 family)
MEQYKVTFYTQLMEDKAASRKDEAIRKKENAGEVIIVSHQREGRDRVVCCNEILNVREPMQTEQEE